MTFKPHGQMADTKALRCRRPPPSGSQSPKPSEPELRRARSLGVPRPPLAGSPAPRYLTYGPWRTSDTALARLALDFEAGPFAKPSFSVGLLSAPWGRCGGESSPGRGGTGSVAGGLSTAWLLTPVKDALGTLKTI